MQQGLESWLVTKDDVRLHLCIYKQQTLTKGNGAKSEGGKRARAAKAKPLLYLVEEENLVWKRRNDQIVFALKATRILTTALVPSEMACFDNSPGRINRQAVWISRDEIVDRLL